MTVYPATWKRTCWRACFSVVACLPLYVPGIALSADAIYREGRQSPQQGEITGYNRTEVVLKQGSQPPDAIPANEIRRIVWDGEDASLNLRRSDEEAGRLERALEAYQQALADAPASARELKTDLTYLIARVTARMAQGDATRADEAIEKLEAFLKANPDHFRFFEGQRFLGEAYLAKQDYARAAAQFEKLAEAPWNEYKMIAGNATARRALKQGDVDAAVKAYQSVLDMPFDKPDEQDEHYSALFGMTECLERQQDYSKAIGVLDEALEELPVDKSRLQAEMYVRRGAVLQAMGQSKQAVLAYLHVDLLFPRDPTLHAESLYHLARLWNAAGRPERAADASSRLRNSYPKSEWALKLGGG